MKLFGLRIGRRQTPTFEAAALPGTGDVVVSCDDLRHDERIPAAKANAIYKAVERQRRMVATGAVHVDDIPGAPGCVAHDAATDPGSSE